MIFRAPRVESSLMRKGDHVICVCREHGQVAYGTHGIITDGGDTHIFMVVWDKLKADAWHDLPSPMYMNRLALRKIDNAPLSPPWHPKRRKLNLDA